MGILNYWDIEMFGYWDIGLLGNWDIGILENWDILILGWISSNDNVLRLDMSKLFYQLVALYLYTYSGDYMSVYN